MVYFSGLKYILARKMRHNARQSDNNLYLLFLFFFFLLLGDAFDYLDGPIFRVTGADIPMPYAHLLETHSVPQVENIVLTVKKSLNLA